MPNKEKHLISIIIAVYNAASNIEKTLLSILNQSVNLYEIILIDGGSTDNTNDIIKKYNNKIAVWVSEKDKGIYDAWNKGLGRAKGNWIMFLGAGDTLETDAVADYLKACDGGELDYVSSRVQLVDEDAVKGRIIGKPWRWKTMRRYMCVAHVGSIHSANLFKVYGTFDANYRITGDYEFLLRCGASTRTAFINKVTANMLLGGVSGTNSGVFKETYRAKNITAQVPAIICWWDELIAITKFKLKKMQS